MQWPRKYYSHLVKVVRQSEQQDNETRNCTLFFSSMLMRECNHGEDFTNEWYITNLDIRQFLQGDTRWSNLWATCEAYVHFLWKVLLYPAKVCRLKLIAVVQEIQLQAFFHVSSLWRSKPLALWFIFYLIAYFATGYISFIAVCHCVDL